MVLVDSEERERETERKCDGPINWVIKPNMPIHQFEIPSGIENIKYLIYIYK